MPSSKVTVPHTLGKQEALRRIKDMLAQQGGDQISDLQETWTDDGGTYSFQIRGFTVSGTLEVRDTEFEIDVNYPLAARPFKKKIESTLQVRAQKALAA